MQRKKALRIKTVLVVMLASVGLAGLLAPSASAVQTENTAGAQKVHRASIDCTTPSGNKSNYSWGDGTTSVTVYFNNHCSHKVKAKLWIYNAKDDTWSTQCLTTNGGTSGRKKFDIGVVSQLKSIKPTKGC